MKAIHENRMYLSTCPVSCFQSKNISFYGHWHNDIEIIFVKKGILSIGINNESRKVTEGSLVICSGKDIHYYNSHGLENEVVLLIFKPDIINCPAGWPENGYFKYKYITPNLINKLDISINLLSEIEKSIDTIYFELETLNKHHDYIIKSNIFYITGLLLRYIPIENSTTPNKNSNYYYINRMHNVLKYLEDNYKNQISLQQAADICNLSVYHFSRLFSNTIGQTFTKYINTLRINAAEELLTNDTLSISFIALDCGFESIRSFNRVFKSIKGVTPSEFRKKHSNN